METKNILNLNKNLLQNCLEYLGSCQQSILSNILNKKIWSIINKSIGKKSFIENPSQLIELSTLSKDFQTEFWLDNLMIVFNSCKKQNLLAFASQLSSIVLLDLDENKIIFTIDTGEKNIHISCLRHYFHSTNNTDLILASFENTYIRVFSSKNDYSCFLKFDTGYDLMVNNFTTLYHKFEKREYIITSTINSIQPMKVWDFNGVLVKELGKGFKNVHYLKVWFNKRNNIYYVINLNEDMVAIYDFNSGDLFRALISKKDWKYSAILLSQDSNDLLIVTNRDSLSIWNVNDSIEEKTIEIYQSCRGLVKWNNQSFIVGCEGYFIVFNYNGETLKKITGHQSVISSLIKYRNAKYGEVLITCAKEGIIKLWGFIKN